MAFISTRSANTYLSQGTSYHDHGFAPIFGQRVWLHVQVLLVGAILVIGKGTVTSVVRVMGLSDDRCFQNYHRVLKHAVWSAWKPAGCCW